MGSARGLLPAQCEQRNLVDHIRPDPGTPCCGDVSPVAQQFAVQSLARDYFDCGSNAINGLSIVFLALYLPGNHNPRHRTQASTRRFSTLDNNDAEVWIAREYRAGCRA